MIDRILALFSGDVGPWVAAPDAAQLAAAALLVEAAWLDGRFDDDERRVILVLLERRFGLTREDAEALLDAGRKAAEDSNQLYAFTRVLKDRFSFEDRIRIVEMLWEVAYADGALHDYEASLMRRVCGLLFVTDRENGLARNRVLKRLGLAA